MRAWHRLTRPVGMQRTVFLQQPHPPPVGGRARARRPRPETAARHTVGAARRLCEDRRHLLAAPHKRRHEALDAGSLERRHEHLLHGLRCGPVMKWEPHGRRVARRGRARRARSGKGERQQPRGRRSKAAAAHAARSRWLKTVSTPRHPCMRRRSHSPRGWRRRCCWPARCRATR